MTQGCNSFFGQDNCIEVIPYLPEAIEYQFDSEPKQVIYSNGGELSYTIEQEKGQCPTDYAVYIEWLNANTRSSSSYCRKLYRYRDSFGRPYELVQGAFIDIVLVDSENNEGAGTILAVKFFSRVTRQISIKKLLTSSGRRPTARDQCGNYLIQGFDAWPLQDTWKVTRIQRLDGQPDDCGNCNFTVTETFDDGTTEIRHQEQRENCPTVAKIPARLDYDKAQKFDIKTSALGYIEAVNFTYGVNQFGVPTSLEIPSECINIYNVIPYIPIGLTIRKSSDIALIREPITQVCSVRGSPPPKVVFNCDQSCNPCESCPDNTCPVICGDHVCCYDESGIVRKEIAIENYCND